MTKTAIIYARVSTVRQADDGLPVESQLEQCQAKADSLGAVVIKVFRDDGISGRTTRRPGFEGAFDYCESNKVDYFICWSTSRFARNRIDAALHKKLLEKAGTRLVYASQEFGEGDDGWLAEAITEVIDEQYSRQISKDTRRSMGKNAADGFFNGGRIPFGFSAVASGKRRRLEPDPSEVPTVRLMFSLCLDGLGCKNIALKLNASGITKRGVRWDKASVASVLKSRTVIGQLAYRNNGETIIANRAHTAIVSDEDFMQVQEKMKTRSPRTAGGTPRSNAVFSGLLRCGDCGKAMMTETARGRGGVQYHYYNCSSFLKGQGCQSRRIPVPALDDLLLSTILNRIFTVENLRDIVLELKQNSSSWIREHEAMIASLAGELKDVESRLRRLYEGIEAGAGLALSDVAPRLRELRIRQDALKAELARLSNQQSPDVGLREEEVLQAAEMFRELVASCPEPKRVRSFLSGSVQRVMLRGDQAEVEYWPSRIVQTADGGSHCEVRWLPDPSTLRTALLYVVLPGRLQKAA